MNKTMAVLGALVSVLVPWHARACPTTTDVLQYYDGPFNATVLQRSGAVVALRDGGTHWCTGTLIAPNLVITAAHCDEISGGSVAVFGYELHGGTVVEGPQYSVESVVERGTSGNNLDYMILRLQGNPTVDHGIQPTPVRAYLPRSGNPAIVVGHPYLSPTLSGPAYKSAGSGAFTGTYRDASGRPTVRFNVVAEAGASGSGVLDQFGNLVALFTNDASQASFGPTGCEVGSLGTPIAQIVKVSPILRAMTSSVRFHATSGSTNNVQLHATCGSAPEQSCYVRVANATQFATAGLEGCTIACAPNATVAVYFDVMPPSRGSMTPQAITALRANVNSIGTTYTTSQIGAVSCSGSSCSSIFTVSGPLDIGCQFDD